MNSKVTVTYTFTPFLTFFYKSQVFLLALSAPLISLGSPVPSPLIPGFMGPLGSVLQMAEEGAEAAEAAAGAGDMAMGAADMAMMGGENTNN